jgi:type II secretory pathway pseudopilin PulG
MNEIILALILLAITIIGTLITKIVLPLLVEYIKEKIGNEKFDNLVYQIEIAIQAAEQLGITKQLTSGFEKYDYVEKYIRKIFPDITDEQIQLLIEGAGKALGIYKDKE